MMSRKTDHYPCNEFRLDLGGCVIAFHCDPAPFSGFLSYWFDRPTTLKDPHIHIDMELVPHRESLKLPNTLLQTREFTAFVFRVD